MVDVSYLVNSFLREGPPKVSMICHLSSFAESKKHSIKFYVRSVCTNICTCETHVWRPE